MPRKPTRLEDAENTLDACASALSLIPVSAIRHGAQWFPSNEALDLILDAKEALERYARRHPANGGNGGTH